MFIKKARVDQSYLPDARRYWIVTNDALIAGSALPSGSFCPLASPVFFCSLNLYHVIGSPVVLGWFLFWLFVVFWLVCQQKNCIECFRLSNEPKCVLFLRAEKKSKKIYYKFMKLHAWALCVFSLGLIIIFSGGGGQKSNGTKWTLFIFPYKRTPQVLILFKNLLLVCLGQV